MLLTISCNQIENETKQNNLFKNNKSIIFNDITYEDDPHIVRIFIEHISTVGHRIQDFNQSNLSVHTVPTDY